MAIGKLFPESSAFVRDPCNWFRSHCHTYTLRIAISNLARTPKQQSPTNGVAKTVLAGLRLGSLHMGLKRLVESRDMQPQTFAAQNLGLQVYK